MERKMESGQQLKEEGQSLVLENAGDSWSTYIIEELRKWCKHRLDIDEPAFRFEEFRDYASKNGMRQPHHANAWGALPARAVREKIIRPTSMYVPAESPSAHARPVRVWEARKPCVRQAHIFDSLMGVPAT